MASVFVEALIKTGKKNADSRFCSWNSAFSQQWDKSVTRRSKHKKSNKQSSLALCLEILNIWDPNIQFLCHSESWPARRWCERWRPWPSWSTRVLSATSTPGRRAPPRAGRRRWTRGGWKTPGEPGLLNLLSCSAQQVELDTNTARGLSSRVGMSISRLLVGTRNTSWLNFFIIIILLMFTFKLQIDRLCTEMSCLFKCCFV